MNGISKLPRVLCLALLVAVGIWGVLMALNPSGIESRVFFESGRDLFGDFRMPRICAEYGYANDRQPLYDSCYPALGSWLVKLFPMGADAVGDAVAPVGDAWSDAMGRQFGGNSSAAGKGLPALPRVGPAAGKGLPALPRVGPAAGKGLPALPGTERCGGTIGRAARPFAAAGGWFTGVGLLLWTGAFLVFAWERGWKLVLPALLGSSIILHTLERGNPIIYAAAGCLLFLAWFDDERSWRRWGAGLGLAVAVALKLTPAVLALLYVVRFREEGERWRGLTLELLGVGVATLLLFAMPFVGFGGWEGFCQWLDNAAANAAHYAHTGAWGFLAIGRTVRAALHMDVTRPWSGMGWERGMDAMSGLACLAIAAWRAWRRRGSRGRLVLLVVAGMLLVPGNMHFYAGIYLLPVLALRLREGMGAVEAGCWFAMLCPLQFPLGAGCLNHPLANLAFLTLVGLTIGVRGGEKARG